MAPTDFASSSRSEAHRAERNPPVPYLTRRTRAVNVSGDYRSNNLLALKETVMALTRDLYLYRASHDGKQENSHRLLGVTLSGGFDREGVQAAIRLVTKP